MVTDVVPIAGGAFDGVMNDTTVFGFGRGEGADAGAGDPDWIVAKDRFKYDQLFDTLNPIDGKITGTGMYWTNVGCTQVF